jgi:alkylation response protein AidB-like acyl-CoA dehydrogenase
MTPFAACDTWMRGHDPSFTALLASRGLIGLSWPATYGGQGARYAARLVVTEELLRVGAPVAAHWIADRQIGPAIMRYGSEELKREFLPRIAAGEVTFCLGMSETESGSDLAAVATRATPDGDGFRINGRKIWTSHAHRSTHAYVLARTGDTTGPRDNLTEFVIDMTSPGVNVRPIRDLVGEHHFNDMVFDDVYVPASHVIGEVGRGWSQVTEQLSFERGGMERVLSTYPLLARLLDAGRASIDDGDTDRAGEIIARLHTLRALARWIADTMDRGEAPVRNAAILTLLGTEFESDAVEFARTAAALQPAPDGDEIERLFTSALVAVPGTTLFDR